MEFDYKSTNAVMGHLRALERKGAIERIPGQARTFRINRPDKPQASFESEINLRNASNMRSKESLQQHTHKDAQLLPRMSQCAYVCLTSRYVELQW